MPVARKTRKKTAGKTGRPPTTVTIGGTRRPKKVARAGGATIVTAGARGTTISAKTEKSKSARRSRKGGKDHGDLPSWTHLESKANRKVRALAGSPFLEAVSTVRFALVLAVVAGAFTLYVGHVHATQELLEETQMAREANHRLHLKYNRVKGQYDRLIGPAEIHRRASALGLIEDAAYGPTVVLED